MASAHYGAPQAFEAVGRAFRGQPRLSLFHAMNLGDPSEIQVQGGRMDREGKGALDILEHLPAWQEEDFFRCLVDGFLEAVQGRGMWRDFRPAEDVVRFLWRDVPESVSVQPSLGSDPVSGLGELLAQPSTPTQSLRSPLGTPSCEPTNACVMLAQALQGGIAWNESKLREAFLEAYGQVPTDWQG